MMSVSICRKFRIGLGLIALISSLAATPALSATTFAIIGDFGSASSDQSDVVGLIDGWNPDFIITTGDNRYTPVAYDEAISQYFCNYLADSGNDAFCAGGNSPGNRFFPSLGNHDYDDGGGLSEYLSYFTLPGNGISSSGTSGNERYYDFVIDSVHFFVIDSEGATLSSADRSAQMSWLQTQMTASTARWKIVYMHHPPYNSGFDGNITEMQWPYAQWGADAVIAGHAHHYERLSEDGILYFVNGLGGHSITGIGSAVPQSQVRYSGGYGAQRVVADDDSITFEFINVQGTVIDSFTVDGNPPPPGYCSASASDQSFEYINRVQLGDLDNTSGPSSYSDFTGQAASLSAGSSANLILTPGFPGTNYAEFWRVWIDYNDDGDFEDAGELVFSGSGSSVVNGSFTVPGSASGQLRMRVTMQWNAYASACGSYTYGEVEDYTVVVSTGQTPPVADFSAGATQINIGDSVQFTDASSGGPDTWSWTFDGGNPASSFDPNPIVIYDSAGTYDVTLSVSNVNGSDSETKTGYIVVTDNPVSYCNASASDQAYEFIARVAMADLDNASGASAYSDFTGTLASLTPGSIVTLTLTPGFPGTSYPEFWQVWIDYNGDSDFEDPGELVFSGSGSAAISGNFAVPANASGQTRMRVNMQWNAFAPVCGNFQYGEVEDYGISFSP